MVLLSSFFATHVKTFSPTEVLASPTGLATLAGLSTGYLIKKHQNVAYEKNKLRDALRTTRNINEKKRIRSLISKKRNHLFLLKLGAFLSGVATAKLGIDAYQRKDNLHLSGNPHIKRWEKTALAGTTTLFILSSLREVKRKLSLETRKLEYLKKKSRTLDLTEDLFAERRKQRAIVKSLRGRATTLTLLLLASGSATAVFGYKGYRYGKTHEWQTMMYKYKQGTFSPEEMEKYAATGNTEITDLMKTEPCEDLIKEVTSDLTQEANEKKQEALKKMVVLARAGNTEAGNFLIGLAETNPAYLPVLKDIALHKGELAQDYFIALLKRSSKKDKGAITPLLRRTQYVYAMDVLKKVFAQNRENRFRDPTARRRGQKAYDALLGAVRNGNDDAVEWLLRENDFDVLPHFNDIVKAAQNDSQVAVNAFLNMQTHELWGDDYRYFFRNLYELSLGVHQKACLERIVHYELSRGFIPFIREKLTHDETPPEVKKQARIALRHVLEANILFRRKFLHSYAENPTPAVRDIIIEEIVEHTNAPLFEMFYAGLWQRQHQNTLAEVGKVLLDRSYTPFLEKLLASNNCKIMDRFHPQLIKLAERGVCPDAKKLARQCLIKLLQTADNKDAVPPMPNTLLGDMFDKGNDHDRMVLIKSSLRLIIDPTIIVKCLYDPRERPMIIEQLKKNPRAARNVDVANALFRHSPNIFYTNPQLAAEASFAALADETSDLRKFFEENNKRLMKVEGMDECFLRNAALLGNREAKVLLPELIPCYDLAAITFHNVQQIERVFTDLGYLADLGEQAIKDNLEDNLIRLLRLAYSHGVQEWRNQQDRNPHAAVPFNILLEYDQKNVIAALKKAKNFILQNEPKTSFAYQLMSRNAREIDELPDVVVA